MKTNISDANSMETGDAHYSEEFRLELDTHANMHVVGKGDSVEFIGTQYDTAQLPIVDSDTIWLFPQ